MPDSRRGPRSLRQVCLTALRACLPREKLLVSGPSNASQVHLTFDDGPHPAYTPQILACLRTWGVQATFFVLGAEAEKHPDLVRQIVSEGHDLGSHAYSHTRRQELTHQDFFQEIRRTDELLRKLVGRTTHFFRPPFGKLTALDLLRLWTANRTVTLWSQDPRDYIRPSAESLLDWFDHSSIGPGDVILLHDNCRSTASALPQLLERLSARGLPSRGCSDATLRAWMR